MIGDSEAAAGAAIRQTADGREPKCLCDGAGCFSSGDGEVRYARPTSPAATPARIVSARRAAPSFVLAGFMLRTQNFTLSPTLAVWFCWLSENTPS
ncbi:hypothetical protein Sa4125_40760 [Aureimonas sp. SA4125]|nr:hypothetical protein Sa4125_40760 [Aureimonas sp. SA4125]